MKVLEVNVDDVGLGGVYSLVRSVILNRPEGLKLDVACIARFKNPENERELNRLGTDVYYVGNDGGKLSRLPAYYRNTLLVLREGAYDCVHIHGDVAYLLLAFALAARRAGAKKVILHSHASDVDGSRRGVKKLLHRLCKPFLKGVATDYAACSDVAAAWMYPKAVMDRVVMVKNGVDVERFAFDPAVRERVREDLGLEGAFVVGHVGRFAYQKNHEFLLDAFAAMKQQIKNARLLMVGEGVKVDQMREKARRLGLEGDAIFYGPSREVDALMQAMDLFALPSRFEGLPIVGVEAQAAGLPVLFSDFVTRQAALAENVWFLPTGEGDAEKWAARAAEVASSTPNRANGSAAVARAGFTIRDTVRAFLGLYGLEAEP